MNEYDLFEAIGNIDKKYVEEAAVSEPSGKRFIRRRIGRFVLVAAALAVLLLGTFVATAHIVYDVRFLQLIGLESTMKELDNGYYQIDLSKTIDDMTVTVVDAIGDAHRQWIEIETTIPTEPFETGKCPEELGPTHFYIELYETNRLTAAFADIDCTERYERDIKTRMPLGTSGSLKPFFRDGHLWLLMEVMAEAGHELNRSFIHFECGFNTANTQDARFTFTWCCNYPAKKETFRINKKNGQVPRLYNTSEDVRITKVEVTQACLDVFAEGSYEDFRLEYITLADGTILYPANRERNVAPEKTGKTDLESWSGWDGWIVCGGDRSEGRTPSSSKTYSLLPNQSFDTTALGERLIPMDEIVAICINGKTIELK